MGLFCEIMILLICLIFLITKADLIPFEELNELMLPYTKYMLMGIIFFILLKYAVYTIRSIQDIRYYQDEDDDTKRKYILLGSYLLCDLLRLTVMLGLLTAIFYQLVPNYPMVNSVVDYLVICAFILIGLAINCMCYESETIKFNLISTAVLLIPVLIYSKDCFIQGIKLFF